MELGISLADGTIITANDFIEGREFLPSTVYNWQNFLRSIAGSAFFVLAGLRQFLYQI